MNKRGFTLIELLVVLVIVGLISIFAIPSIFSAFDTSKEKSREILVKNIYEAVKEYSEECENGNLESHGATACKTKKENNSDYIIVSIEELAKTGFLKINYDKDITSTGSASSIEIIDPVSNENIGTCQIKVQRIVNKTTTAGITNYIVSYSISDAGTHVSKCPQSSEYK